jgi:hypothetical protein
MSNPNVTDEFKYWKICAWNGPLFMIVYMIFWGMCFNYPPRSGALTAAQVAATFREWPNLFRTGMVVAMTFAVSYAVWAIAISKVQGKIVGKDSILNDLQVWGGGLTVVPLLVTSAMWLTAGYSPDLPDTQLKQLLDNAWMLLDMAYSVTSVQMFAMGVAFLADKRVKPLMPRWVAWYGIWVGIAFIAECLMPFYKTGPFARNGWLNFWVEFLIWFAWAFLVSFYVIKGITRLQEEALAESEEKAKADTKKGLVYA